MNFVLDKTIFKSIEYYLTQSKIECSKCSIKPPPSYVRVGPKSRIIVIGDIHGDFLALLLSLEKAGLINKKGGWVGKDTIVVQLGDQIDKGGRGVQIQSNIFDNPLDELRVIEFMHNLHYEAKIYGGAVYNLIGNHELMNIIGDFRYATQEHINAFGGESIRKKLFKPGGAIAKKLACNTNAIMRIGNWIFVHGGLLPNHIESNSIHYINNQIRDLLLGNQDIDNISNNFRELLFGTNGFLWNRIYSGDTRSDQKKCSTLNKTLELLNVSKKGGMVVGHTPQSKISSVCDNRLWMADVGMSTAFGNKSKEIDRVEVLEIINDGEIVRAI